MRNPFSECHPIINFIFYIGAFVMGMCFLHPIFLAISLSLALGYFLLTEKRKTGFLLGMMSFAILITIVNPLFNTQGKQVLFTYLNGRPYTIEALCYGIAIAAMFVTILIWFSTYQRVMTSDKFLYCFGRIAPAASLILTMVFRLVPNFQRKARQISEARRCIGKAVDYGTRKEKATQGAVILSVLASCALEGGVIMSDSMQSRGFGSGKRTACSIYPFRTADRSLLVFMLLMEVIICFCAWKGGMNAAYTPELCFSTSAVFWTRLGSICYFAFLSIPIFMYILEEMTWRILKSKI